MLHNLYVIYRLQHLSACVCLFDCNINKVIIIINMLILIELNLTQ